MSRAVTHKTWRKVIKVHPAAELSPLMDEAELRELGEDIKKNGLTTPIVIFSEQLVPGDPSAGHKYSLLDGRNRLDAMELVGIEFRLIHRRGKFFQGYELESDEIISMYSRPLILNVNHNNLGDEVTPLDFVISANLHRRHLTPEQKRALIANLLKNAPEKSDRQIGEVAKASHHTVASVRADQEGRGQIAHVETRTDTQGRKQPARKERVRTQGNPSGPNPTMARDTFREEPALQRTAAPSEPAVAQIESAPAGEAPGDRRVENTVDLTKPRPKTNGAAPAQTEKSANAFHDKLIEFDSLIEALREAGYSARQVVEGVPAEHWAAFAKTERSMHRFFGELHREAEYRTNTERQRAKYGATS
jgi:hypothetical protein